MTAWAQALAFRIWRYADPKGWDCTVAEVAEALDVNVNHLSRVIKMKRWEGRLRPMPRMGSTYQSGAPLHSEFGV